MHAVAGAHDVRTNLASVETPERILELGRSVALGDLAETSALTCRRAIGQRAGEAFEASRCCLDVPENPLGTLDGLGVGGLIILRRFEQNVQRLVEVRAAEPGEVGLVVAAAIRLRRLSVSSPRLRAACGSKLPRRSRAGRSRCAVRARAQAHGHAGKEVREPPERVLPPPVERTILSCCQRLR